MSQIKYVLLAAIVFLLDQLSKWYVMERILLPKMSASQAESLRAPLDLISWYSQTLERLPYTEIEVFGFFNWVMVWNHGISFGLFNQQSDYGPMLLIALSSVIALVFLIWLFKSKSAWQSISIAIVIGGAIGNVIDRLRFDAVIDFLDFHFMGYHWPAFNIADSAIVVGILMLLGHSLFFETHEPKQEPVKNT